MAADPGPQARAANEALQAQVEEMPALRAKAARLRGIAVDHAELERLRQSYGELQREVLQLRGRGATAMAERALPPTTRPTPEGAAKADTTQLPASMSAAMQRAVEQQTLAKLPRLKASLNLSPQQEAAVREILTGAMTKGLEIAEKSVLGTLTQEEMAKIQQSPPPSEQQIRALLTPEQQAAYEGYKQEEAEANASLRANAELLQMHSSLGLTPEQQDQVFYALYNHAVALSTGKLVGEASPPYDPAESIRWMVDQKIKLLEPILAPEQLEQYRKLQENQAKLMTDLMPKPAAK